MRNRIATLPCLLASCRFKAVFFMAKERETDSGREAESEREGEMR